MIKRFHHVLIYYSRTFGMVTALLRVLTKLLYMNTGNTESINVPVVLHGFLRIQDESYIIYYLTFRIPKAVLSASIIFNFTH